MKTQDEIIQIIDDEIQDTKDTIKNELDWLSKHPDSEMAPLYIDTLTASLKRIEIIKSRILAPIMTTKEALTKLDDPLTQCNEQIDSIDRILLENGNEIKLVGDEKESTKFKGVKTQ